MRFGKTFTRAIPYLGAVGIVVTSILLCVTLFLTRLELQWVAFLAGVLIASSIALSSRFSSNAWTIARRNAQLAAARNKFSAESVLRERAEKALGEARRSPRFLEEALPAMLAYLDQERRVRFHNRAYAEWLGMPGADIEGQTVSELLGPAQYAEVKDRLDEAYAGSLVRYDRARKLEGAHTFRIAAQYLPHFGAQGTVLGVFVVLTDITRQEDIEAEREIYARSMAGELTEWRDVAHRLSDALANDEFTLYAQDIVPVAGAAPEAPFLEVLLRLKEEEDNLMPPGAFIPLAEQHGMLPDLDRWVVRHVVAWAASASGSRGAVSVNVSGATMGDPGIVEFVREQLAANGLEGRSLCFEFGEADALADPDGTARFVRELKRDGCRFALSGFGREPVSFALLKQLPFDYLKIDAGIIVNLPRSDVAVARVRGITRVAKSLGIRTIAECVESVEIQGLLRGLGVDFAQGFAISRPAPLADRGATRTTEQAGLLALP